MSIPVTPLQVTVHAGNVEVIQALLDAGGSLEAEDLNFLTPLESAVRRGNMEMVETLIWKIFWLTMSFFLFRNSVFCFMSLLRSTQTERWL